MARNAWLVLALLVLVGAWRPAFAVDFRGAELDPPRSAPDFALKSSNGKEFRLSQYRGKVVALGFGYTYCPDVCPTTLWDLSQARKRLGADAKCLRVAYVTVDPDRDTAERLRIYLGAFDKSFLGLTGTDQQLSQVQKAYGVSVEKQASIETLGAYQIHHSSFVYLIDAAGRLRVMLPFGRSVDDIAHDVKLLLSRSPCNER